MCGIVSAVSQRNIVPILLQGLQRLEYRGYDSCGLAVHDGIGPKRARSTARVAELQAQTEAEQLQGTVGIAHTRTLAMAQMAKALPKSPWCTTASSKTTSNCACNCKPKAMYLRAKPIPR